jgi:hypothetical protein
MFGGNPRSMLEMAVDCDYEEKLGATIESLNIAQAMRDSIGNTLASVTVDSSLVFYFQPQYIVSSRKSEAGFYRFLRIP